MDHAALKVAIDLLHFPSQVRRIRSIPLPNGVIYLLRVTAGDEAEIRQATEMAGRSRETVCAAAAFFAEQILLYPDADSYRVLGAKPEATNGELRRHMTLLLRWLHPDLDPRGERSVYTARVTRAWNDLKTQERRDAYDLARRAARSNNSRSRKRSMKHSFNQRLQKGALYSSVMRPDVRYRGGPKGFFRRVLFLLFRRVVH